MKQTGTESNRDEGDGIDRILWRTHNEGVPFVETTITQAGARTIFVAVMDFVAALTDNGAHE